MTIDQRRDEPTVHIPADRSVVGLRGEGGGGIVSAHVRPHVQTVLVTLTTPIADVEVVGIEILHGFALHGRSSDARHALARSSGEPPADSVTVVNVRVAELALERGLLDSDH